MRIKKQIIDEIHYLEYPKDAKFHETSITVRWGNYIRQQLSISKMWEVYSNRNIHKKNFIATLPEEEKKELERTNYDCMRNSFESIIINWQTKQIQQLPTIKKRSRHISSEVKREVWQRDFGRCVECDSKERLEYDHIIPFSKGGSNTARNIQLLCENCNRKKHDKI